MERLSCFAVISNFQHEHRLATVDQTVLLTIEIKYFAHVTNFIKICIRYVLINTSIQIVLFLVNHRDRKHTQKRSLGKQATIHQVTTMLATCKNVLFPGHNHLLTTCSDDLILWLSPDHRREVKGHQYRWLEDDYDLEIGHL